MAVTAGVFDTWLAQADIPRRRLTPQVVALLHAVSRFRQRQGPDYFSTRLVSHFLLHCESGLKVAQVARLLGISRPAASGQQGLSSREVVRQAHHRLKGRPYGKLLPRFAGPIAGFLVAQSDASRADLLDFIEATFGVRVSRIAAYKFLKKYGLDHLGQAERPRPQPGSPVPPTAPALPAPPAGPAPALPAPPAGPAPASALPPQSPTEAGPASTPPPRPAEQAPPILLPDLPLVPAPSPRRPPPGRGPAPRGAGRGGPGLHPPRHARRGGPRQSSCPTCRWCRPPPRPPFLRPDAARRCLPADGPRPGLAGHRPGLL